MAIEITCLICGKVLHIPDAAAGKKGKCPNCGAILQVPVVGGKPFTEADLDFQPTVTTKSESQERTASEGRKWQVLTPDGQQFGPADESEVITWIQEGRIGIDSQVWREGMNDWTSVNSVTPFSQYCSRPQTAPRGRGSSMNHRIVEAVVTCPNCNSAQIQAIVIDEKEKSPTIKNVCLKCGHQWFAGSEDENRMRASSGQLGSVAKQAEVQRQKKAADARSVGCLVAVIVIVVLIVIGILSGGRGVK